MSCFVFVSLVFVILFFLFLNANELRQSEMDIKVFPDALVLINISATHVARLAREKEREKEKEENF